MENRNIIVIGASMGGLETLSNLVVLLPGDLPASIFVVLHISPESESNLPQILKRSSALNIKMAENGEIIKNRSIYVAPPNQHLLISDRQIKLSHGPKENLSRPAIDPLFRSAAESFGPRVIGIILSGLLNDGASGLYAVKQCGGIAIVQDPADALYPEMPLSALESVEADYIIPILKIGAILNKLVRESVPSPTSSGPKTIQLENEKLEHESYNRKIIDEIGKPSNISCPECGGPLLEIESEKIRRYKCLLGHAYTDKTLLADQTSTIERTLLIALRTMEEKASMLSKLAMSAETGGFNSVASIHLNKAEEIRNHGENIRKLLLDGL